MTKFSQPGGQPLLAGSPPGSLDGDQHNGYWAKGASKSLLPVPGVYELGRNRNRALLRQASEPAGKIFRIDGGLIQGNSVRHDVNIDQPQADIQV